MTILALLKTAHILAMTTWMAGMIVMPMLALRGVAVAPLRAVFAALATPAMLLTWALGLYLASSGGWLREAWMATKLILVVVMSGLHGFLAGRLRRLATDAAWRPDPLFRNLHWVVLGLLAIIVALVIAKP